MTQTEGEENHYVGQPRDAKGRYASWGLAGDGINEAVVMLEEELLTGTTADITDAARRLVAAVDRVPTLTIPEAQQVLSAISSSGAGLIPTDIWIELERACLNASSSANGARDTINKKRLTARAKRDRTEINGR